MCSPMATCFQVSFGLLIGLSFLFFENLHTWPRIPGDEFIPITAPGFFALLPILAQDGCASGFECQFCHICPPGVEKNQFAVRAAPQFESLIPGKTTSGLFPCPLFSPMSVRNPCNRLSTAHVVLSSKDEISFGLCSRDVRTKSM